MFTRRPALYHPYKRPSSPAAPAGIRIPDFFRPKRCFNLFQEPNFDDARSPNPSPLNSPIRGSSNPTDDRDRNDDASPPPTLGLADFFANIGLLLPQQRPSTPPPSDRARKVFQDYNHNRDDDDNDKNDNVALPPPRKRKHGPKHLSFSKPAPPTRPHRRPQKLNRSRDGGRRRMLDLPHERRASRAREAMRRLEKRAEALMKPGQMDAADEIVLRELRRLGMDLSIDEDLARCRGRIARAATDQETKRRREAQARRDEEAARMCEEPESEAVLEERRKQVEAYVRGIEEEKAAYYRKMEEEAMRADEARRRVHEERERRIREEQERVFRREQEIKVRQEEERRQREERERRERQEKERRQREEEERQRLEELERRQREEREQRRREEQQRRLREERERRRREERQRRVQAALDVLMEETRAQRERDRMRQAHERRLYEERERLAREERARRAAEEEARRAAEEEQIRRYFALYEAKWHELRTSDAIPPIDVGEMPWPVFGVVLAPEQITEHDVRTFLFHPLRPGAEGKSARDRVKPEVLRFHPDKFDARIVPKIKPSQQTVAQAIAGAVARILTRIMTEQE